MQQHIQDLETWQKKKQKEELTAVQNCWKTFLKTVNQYDGEPFLDKICYLRLGAWTKSTTKHYIMQKQFQGVIGSNTHTKKMHVNAKCMMPIPPFCKAQLYIIKTKRKILTGVQSSTKLCALCNLFILNRLKLKEENKPAKLVCWIRCHWNQLHIKYYFPIILLPTN